MDVTIAFPTTLSRPQARPTTAAIRRRAAPARARIAALALAGAVLAGLVLGLVDGAAGRPLGDPGPTTGPEPRLVGLVHISPDPTEVRLA